MDRNPARVNPEGHRPDPGADHASQGNGAPVSFSHTTRSTTCPAPRKAPRRVRAGLLALALLLAPPLAGCSVFEAPPTPRGNRADPDLLAQLTPGVQTQADVQALLGSPTATGTFDRGTWYYISSVTRMRPAGNPHAEQQRVVAISFDERGVIRNIEERGPETMREVDVVSRTTPVPGTDRTLLQALFGNIGRVGAGGMGAEQGPGVGPVR